MKLTAQDIDLAVDFLSKLKSDTGEVSADSSLVFASDGFDTVENIPDRHDASSASGLLGRIKTIKDTLRVAQTLLEEGLAHAKSQVLPLVHGNGLMSLPDELLGRIFKLATTEDSAQPLQLACRSLRRRALTMAEIWTDLSTDIFPLCHLERSGMRGLNVAIRRIDSVKEEERRRDTLRLKMFLILLKPHTSRLVEISICNRSDYGLNTLSSDTYPKVFPNLHHLELDYVHDIFTRGDCGSLGVVSQWQMPALRSLVLNNFIPSRIQASPTKCEVSLLNGYAKSLPRLLGTFDSLRELSIRVDGEVERHHEGPPVLLAQVEKLHLEMEATSLRIFEYLLASIQAPNVRDLSVYIHPFYEEDIVLNNGSRIVNVLFPEEVVRWPQTQTLKFKFEYDTNMLVPSFIPALHTAMARLPRTSQLIIESTCYNADDWSNDSIRSLIEIENPKLAVHHTLRDGPTSYPPIRCLTLSRCPFDATFIVDNIGLLNSLTFKTLRIEECVNMDENVLRAILPRDKVLMKDGVVIHPTYLDLTGSCGI